jgi:adenylate cyclase
MTENSLERKLRAILSADVKGYSRLMGEDEEYTIKTITAYRETIFGIISKHKGRVVDSPGDNILAEFASAVNAVSSAIEIQETLKEKNANLPDNRKMEFRIGINLGEIMQEGDRIYGDGVNVAARIEGLTDPSGVCISRNIYDQVKKKLTNLGYEYIGAQDVKNISEPVRVYKILMDPEYAGKLIGEETPKPSWPRTAIAALVVLIILAGSIAVWNFYFRGSSIEPASIDKMAYPLPKKPSIAVLPFDNMSGDSEQEYLADGISENIISALSKVSKLFVIARNSTFTYKGKSVKIRQISEDLGVRYVLEGSIQRSGNRLRVTSQLIDAITGNHLWSDRYDRDLKDIFALQDEITLKILVALQVELTHGEQAHIWAKGTKNLDAYLKLLQAREHYLKMNVESNTLARKMAEEAIALDPEYADAYSWLGATHMLDVFLGSTKAPKDSIVKAIELTRKALALDDSLVVARSRLGFLFTMIRQHEKGVAEAEKGVALNPNSAGAYDYLGFALRFAGRPEEAIPMIKKALRLNPFPPGAAFYNLGMAYLYTGKCEEAISACEKALQRETDNLLAHITATAAYSMCGREEEARKTAAEVLRINPKFTTKYFEKKLPYKNQSDTDRYIAALRKAGLPDTPPLPLPDKPSIAVLPFENMSDDPKQEYFADGITDDLTTDLSKISGLFVIARNSSFTYKGKSVKIPQVARDLGVRYILEGSVRKVDDKVRINAQLIDATTDHHLWAERFDGKLGDIFAVQDRFTRKIVAALAIKLTADDQELLSHKGTDNVDAYVVYLQGWEHLVKNTREDLLDGVNYLKKAIKLDPNYGQAYAALAMAYSGAVVRSWDKGLGWTDARSLSRKYLQMAMKNPTPEAYRAAARIHLYQRKYEQAIAEAERAMVLDPNSPHSYFSMARVLIHVGRSSEAVDFLNRAMRLDPHYPALYLEFLGYAQFCLDQFEEAANSLKIARKRNPKSAVWMPAATSAHLGRVQEASDMMTEYMKRRGYKRRITTEKLMPYYPFKDSADEERFLDGLIKAGLPSPWNPVYRRQYEEAISKTEQGVALNPDNPEAHFTMGETLIFSGRSAEAIDFIKKAIALDPKHPPFYLWYLGLANFCQENFEEAAASLEKCYKRDPKESKWLLAATYAHLGRKETASDMLSKYMKGKGYKDYSVEKVLKYDGWHAFKDPKDMDRFTEGLHKAGLK